MEFRDVVARKTAST